MKQLYRFFLLLLAISLPTMINAHDFEVDGIYYIINGNEATVTFEGSDYTQNTTRYTGDVFIPATFTNNGNTYTVTSINYCAFFCCSSLTSVSIPNSVTSIGNSAFNNCSSLTSVTIGNSVTSIGFAAFESCSSLTSVTIGNSVTSIDYNAFYGCSSLISVSIPNSVTSIGNYAFYNCTSLVDLTLGESLKSIGKGAFRYCSITKVVIPNSVTSISGDAFADCDSLKTVVIGKSCSEIGKYAFWGDGVLRNVKCLSSTPPTMENETCFSNYWFATLYVPESSLSRYQSTSYWNHFYKILPAVFDDEANILCSNIVLNLESSTLFTGDTLLLSATIIPEYANNKTVTWKSSDTSVAIVNSNGKVTAVSTGTATITATTTDGSGVYASCLVQVLPDYYLTMDTLMHVRGRAEVIVDFPISLTNRNGISAIQFDMSLPDCISFEDDGGLPILWLDDNRKTRSHNLSVTMLGDNSCRVVIASTSSKELKGNEGPFVHMSIVLHKMHNIGNFTIKISNIIAAEADETRHTLSNAYSTVHCYYIVGDADSDASVDIADFNATGSKILLKNPSPFYSDAANVDNNSSIDVADLVGITNIAIGVKPITLRQAPRRNDGEDKLTCELLKLQSGEERDITFGMDCGFDFAGFQMDVLLPDGLSLTGAYLGQDASGLGLATAELPDGSIRLLGASFSDVEITGNCPQLLTLRVKADNAYNYNEKISIDSIVFAERNLTCHYFDGSCIEFIEHSAVQELSSEVRIYVQNGNIIIDTPFAGLAQLISVDGRVLEHVINVGHNVIEVNCSGIYIVNFVGKAIKVLL